jgi:hypothetical protein
MATAQVTTRDARVRTVMLRLTEAEYAALVARAAAEGRKVAAMAHRLVTTGCATYK